MICEKCKLPTWTSVSSMSRPDEYCTCGLADESVGVAAEDARDALRVAISYAPLGVQAEAKALLDRALGDSVEEAARLRRVLDYVYVCENLHQIHAHIRQHVFARGRMNLSGKTPAPRV